MELPEGVKIEITKEKAEEYFYNALCNGLGEISQYGLVLDYDENEYREAAKILKSKAKSNFITGFCFEDVLMEMLRQGYSLKFIDRESNERDGEYSRTIKFEDVHDKVKLTPIEHLTDMITESDDAITAACIIQAVLYDGEIIFG